MRTFGVEEELLVVDPTTGQALPLADRMLAVAGRPQDMSHEFKLEQIEIQTVPCRDHDEILGALYTGRRLADRAARACGGRIAALATSPLPVESSLTPNDRFARMNHEFGLISREQLTCGLHVHVGVDSPAEGVAILDRIREWLPALVALTGNSPYWFGIDTGYSSFRTQAWNRWPSSGPQEIFGEAATYRKRVDAMIATGAILDEGMAYFDARLSRLHPTVEVRVADVPLLAADSALVAVLVRALVETAAREANDGVAPLGTSVALLRLAAWRASRSGLDGELVHPATCLPVPAAEALDALLAHVAPVLRETGEFRRTERAFAEVLERGTGARAQRLAAEAAGIPAAVRMALERTASPEGTWDDGSRVALSVVRRATNVLSA
ncbi:glutamate--cysteine ligase [Sinomonas terrae]|uniref:Putative glutamate--cysteine ligase 2 n=1 Tax=Sinomonas terrae TaxID=2908838 RepID=A0ABS9TXM8_9MICC|nr:glutamate--cysteine ligase [Sinomonas terrae]MCH6468927.1 glutamate--cysteine ligase [Sinomonas terrae]